MKRNGEMKMGYRLIKFCWLANLRLKVAFIVWRMRQRAGMSRQAAARLLEIDASSLRSYEWGFVSPPMCKIAHMAQIYRANEDALYFFCATRATWLSKFKM